MNQVLNLEKDGDVKLESSMMLQLHDRDMNQQIATAKRFPRQLARVIDEIEVYATESEETAQECIYALPRDGKKIIGPTARFAEIVATSWGNARYAARIIDENDTFVVAQAVFHDLEKNNFISVEVPRRIVDRNGRRFGVDMIGVTSSAAMSIAMRNAILKGVPKAAWGPAYSKCLALISGTFETIEARRTAALKAFSKQGVPDSLVLQLLGKESVREIEPDDIVVLRGTLQAIKDGDTTLRAVFGDLEQDPKNRKKADIGGHLDKGRANGKKEGANPEGGQQAGSSKGSSAGAASSRKGDRNPDAGEDRGGKPGDDPGADGVGDGGEPELGLGDAAADGSADADRNGDAGGDGGTAAGTAAGEAGSGGGVAEDLSGVEIPDFPGDGEWTEGETLKLKRLVLALDNAPDAATLTAVSNEFLPVFEAGRGEAEAEFTKLVSARRQELRNASRGSSARDKL